MCGAKRRDKGGKWTNEGSYAKKYCSLHSFAPTPALNARITRPVSLPGARCDTEALGNLLHVTRLGKIVFWPPLAPSSQKQHPHPARPPRGVSQAAPLLPLSADRNLSWTQVSMAHDVAKVNSCVKCTLGSLGCSPVLRGAIDDLAIRIHVVAVRGNPSGQSPPRPRRERCCQCRLAARSAQRS